MAGPAPAPSADERRLRGLALLATLLALAALGRIAWGALGASEILP
jgi:hypothetical protein